MKDKEIRKKIDQIRTFSSEKNGKKAMF